MASVASSVDIDDFEFVVSDISLDEDIENNWCLINIENGKSPVNVSSEENVSAVEYDFMIWSDDSECEEGESIDKVSKGETGESIDKDSECEEHGESVDKEDKITSAVENDWLVCDEDSEKGYLENADGIVGKYDWLIWSDDSESELVEDMGFESIEGEKGLTDPTEFPVRQTEELEFTHDQLEGTDSHSFENIDYPVFSNTDLSDQQEFCHDFENDDEEFFPGPDFYLNWDGISNNITGDIILDVHVTERVKMSRKRDHLGNRARKKYSKKDHGLKKYSWKSYTYDSY